MRGKPEWSPEATAILREQWGNGETPAAIAKTMGNVSRVAIIAKASRLGLESHHQHGGARNKLPGRHEVVKLRFGKGESNISMPALKADPKVLSSAAWRPVDGHIGMALHELEEGQCRWPCGTDLPFIFCGAPVLVEGEKRRSYCAAHQAIAFQKVTK